MNSRLILVVDDEPTIRESIAELLAVEGYECLCAGNGHEAIITLENSKRRPHAILLDQMMPKMTGEQFLQAVKKIPQFSSLPVILISASHEAHKIAQDHGAEFVRKPLDADILMKVIERACKK